MLPCLQDAADEHIEALAHKAQGGDDVEDVLQVAPRPRVRVRAAHGHIGLAVQAPVLLLQGGGWEPSIFLSGTCVPHIKVLETVWRWVGKA